MKIRKRPGNQFINQKLVEGELSLEKLEDFFIPVTESGCWLWFIDNDKAGYGRVRFYTDLGKRRTARAHRIVYQLCNGPVPDDMLVCHKCDTPACVNPDHLFLGTSADNNHDRDKKGRNNSGTKVFSDELMNFIQQSECDYRTLEMMFGISRAHVFRAKRGTHRRGKAQKRRDDFLTQLSSGAL